MSLTDFEKAAELILSSGGTVSVQGARGIGKTALCRRLAAAAAEKGMPAAFIDAELARGIAGPPASVSMILVDSPGDTEKTKPDFCSFVGDIIPAGHTAGYIYGITAAASRARMMGAKLTVIDSCGWLDYPGVVLAKQNEIEMTAPDYIIVLQRNHEAEFIATPFIKRADICCAVKNVPDASTYSPEIAKANYRTDMLRALGGSRPQIIPFSRATFTNTWLGCGRELRWQYMKAVSGILDSPILHGEQLGKTLYLLTKGNCTEQQAAEICSMLKVNRAETVDPAAFEDLYAGLEDSEGRFLAPGIIKTIDFEKRQLIISTPALTVSPVRGIRFGFTRFSV
ncbi:MAG: hypothetical protein ILO36_02475 [Abditibacteriota bacterium]|nr:hypothetical protein [Abditibacteriota bacterium]